MLLPTFDDSPMYVNGQRVTCNLDGMAIGCSQAFSMLANGSAAQCPDNNCGPRVYNVKGRNVLSSPFMAYADGRSGFNVPIWGSVSLNWYGEPRGPETRSIIGCRFVNTTAWAPQIQSGQASDRQYLFEEVLTRDSVKKVVSAVEDHLAKNKHCKDFVNNLLSQLDKDDDTVDLGGKDIGSFLKEFADTGTMLASIMVFNGGGPHSGQGEIRAPAWGNRTNEANVVLFLHELIHAIGERGQKSVLEGFTDVAAAKALEKLGIAIPLDDYRKINPNRSEYRAAGDLWGSLLSHFCGANLNPQPPSGLQK